MNQIEQNIANEIGADVVREYENVEGRPSYRFEIEKDGDLVVLEISEPDPLKVHEEFDKARARGEGHKLSELSDPELDSATSMKGFFVNGVPFEAPFHDPKHETTVSQARNPWATAGSVYDVTRMVAEAQARARVEAERIASGDGEARALRLKRGEQVNKARLEGRLENGGGKTYFGYTEHMQIPDDNRNLNERIRDGAMEKVDPSYVSAWSDRDLAYDHTGQKAKDARDAAMIFRKDGDTAERVETDAAGNPVFAKVEHAEPHDVTATHEDLDDEDFSITHDIDETRNRPLRANDVEPGERVEVVEFGDDDGTPGSVLPADIERKIEG